MKRAGLNGYGGGRRAATAAARGALPEGLDQWHKADRSLPWERPFGGAQDGATAEGRAEWIAANPLRERKRQF